MFNLDNKLVLVIGILTTFVVTILIEPEQVSGLTPMDTDLPDDLVMLQLIYIYIYEILLSYIGFIDIIIKVVINSLGYGHNRPTAMAAVCK